ncbi:unnamed protein product [Arabidopsis thaliana]|uniref:Mediator-associated-like protein n=2 Tax=Arabidopsis thaliana TaxID=3702 RepID=Q9FMY2_ARATH|nr:mediator-associated-like protein [Arabidopsis thaliana]AED93130.1 mediator-associated-like protein [Arabidopsis thaliana]BAB11173.1 unnamed protein product [Arabidopsis thaliana]CAA0404301.1 unnamed protein product [Arabidopsis thaliana]CAD5332439.1 unnamed protein product [Arabidopsis thaliana]|eukprot:NP_197709.1 mediator-associated-like protein [Arabidopsis thaliana]
MAPKQPEKIENPPMASAPSSEKESGSTENEYGSSGEETNSSDDEHEEARDNVISTPLSFGQELVSFFKVENLTYLGIDEAKWIAYWDMVKDGPKKREVEKQLKKMLAMQMELFMMRTGFTKEVATVLFKQDNASSSGK